MVLEDANAIRILGYLADRYRPVSSEWVDASDIASALGIEPDAVDQLFDGLRASGLVEMSLPDEEHESSAAIITVKGLLDLGRAP
jgi:DNA-binding transcriptional ArsR family regulator